MKAAIEEAIAGMNSNAGGPFGAVVVMNDRIVSRAHNEVFVTHDPTAHAEVTAIRKASLASGRFDLSDCEIYSSCEPCPMCFSAIFWSRIKWLYFACSRFDAEKIGFDDKLLYDIFAGNAVNTQFEKIKLDDQSYRKPFEAWIKKTDKIRY